MPFDTTIDFNQKVRLTVSGECVNDFIILNRITLEGDDEDLIQYLTPIARQKIAAKARKTVLGVFA